MTRSHKLLVLVPPLLIGLTFITVFFSWQHNQNQQSQDEVIFPTASSTDFSVTEPVPPFQQGSTTEPLLPSAPDETTSSPTMPPLDPGDMIACSMDAKMCPDGSFVGREGPDCEFAACPVIAPNYTACAPNDRLAEACIEIYAPVCGLQEVQCVTAPCDPVPVNFSNGCFACMDETVIGYTEGMCAI